MDKLIILWPKIILVKLFQIVGGGCVEGVCGVCVGTIKVPINRKISLCRISVSFQPNKYKYFEMLLSTQFHEASNKLSQILLSGTTEVSLTIVRLLMSKCCSKGVNMLHAFR